MVSRLVAISVLALVGACASTPKQEAAPAVLDHDAIQVVRIETVGPEGRVQARCGVKNDRGTSEILAPGVAEVVRSARPLEVLCYAPGYRMAMRSLESSGDLVGPAATGVVAGGAVSALAALPLLAVPVMGPFLYAGTVGGAALIGGAANAADKHSKGKIYGYPPSTIVTMVPESAPLNPLPARPLVAVSPAPQAVAGLSAAPSPAATPMAPARALAPLLPLAHEVPAFPPGAAQAGVSEGRVRVRVDIDADGNVIDAKVVEARPEHLFDQAVLEVAKRWRFSRGEAGRRFETEIEFRR